MVNLLRLLLLPSALLLLVPTSAVAQESFADGPLVYVFVVDGLDGDRVDQGRAPFLSRLLAGAEGARSTYYRESRSIMVAETNNNHAAMATGAYADRSGIPGNSFAIQGQTESEDSCAPASAAGGGVTVVSGENANCLQAETLFQAAQRQRDPGDITTAGTFDLSKPVDAAGEAAPALRRIRLTVTPGRVRAGRRTRFRFRATVRSDDDIAPRINCPSGRSRRAQACKSSHRLVPVRGATIRFAGRRLRTNARGRATRVISIRRPGRRLARATRSGLRPGADRVRVLRAAPQRRQRREPQLTG